MAELALEGASRIQEGEALQIATLPNFEKVLTLESDGWVFRYEQLQAQLARKQRRLGETQDGVFYTPVSIAAYLVQQTLGAFLAGKTQAIGAAVHHGNRTEALNLFQQVRQLKVIDPACGTGVFLAEALKIFYGFYRQIQAQYPDFLPSSGLASALLGHLYGIDLDPVSVAIAELRVTQMAAQWLHAPLSDCALALAGHLVCADTLCNNPCNNPFPEMQWAFVLGNPPYVSEVRKQSGRLKALQKQGHFYQAKMDLCDAFTAWGAQHLRRNGQLAFVLPEYWMQRTSSASLRNLLWQEGCFQEIWLFGNQAVFKAAPGHHTSLLIWQKQALENAQPAQPIQWGQLSNAADLAVDNLRPGVLLQDARSGKLILSDSVSSQLLNRLALLPPLLQKPEIQQGVVLPQGRLKQADWQKLPSALQKRYAPDSGIFLLTPAEIERLWFNPAECALLKPYYGPTGFIPFQGFSGKAPLYQLLYTDQDARRQMTEKPENYPALVTHLERLNPVLTSAFKPYGLHRPRQKQWFERPNKIFSPRQVAVPSFAVVPETAYVSEGFYSILTGRNEHYLCGILNSRLGWFWLYHQKRKGSRLQIDKDVLLALPDAPAETASLAQAIGSVAKKLSKRNASDEEQSRHWVRLNQLVYQRYGLTPAEMDCVEIAYQSVVVNR